MAFFDTTWYCNSVGYAAIAARPQNTAVAVGALRRQFTAPTLGNERVFICAAAGTTANTTDASWTVSRGAKVTDGTVTWIECTGMAAVNGDATNTPTWAQAKAVAQFPEVGNIIKRNNGVSYQILSTTSFGLLGASEPAFSDTAGVTTTDNGNVWTSLGPVGNFTGGGAPHARLANVFGFNWYVAGQTVYVASNHAESQTTAISLSPVGAFGLVNRIICHNSAGSYPPTSPATGATISTTAAANITLAGPNNGAVFISGLTFRAGVGAASGLVSVTASGSTLSFDGCVFDIANSGASVTSSAVAISSGSSGATAFNNTTVKFAHVGQGVTLNNGQFSWRATGPILAVGSLVPTTFMLVNAGQFATIILEALDLSQLTGNLMAAGSAITTAFGQAAINDCKLNAAATFTILGRGFVVQLNRSDSSATAYKSARYQYEGAETTETTITRVGGAVDPNGLAQSRKIVTAAGAQWLQPFKAEPYAIWHATTGANVTVTVYGTINSASLPNNDEIWMEVEYLGSSAFPVGTIVNTTKASLLASNAAVTSDNSSWDGGGSGAGWSPFKLVATVTPGMASVIEARIHAAKASTTYYIDPQIVLT